MINESEPILSIIAVTYNSADDIEEFYSSLIQQNISWELFFIDNASQDDTCERIRKISTNDSRVHVIENEKNVGLAAANNQPIGLMRGRYVSILNPDLIVEKSALRTLVYYLKDHRDVVAVGPINVDQYGHPHSSFHRNWTLIHLFVWRILPLSLTGIIYRLVRRYTNQDVLFVSGACLVTSRTAFEGIGGYDPEYFLTVEDVCDLCIRLKSASGQKAVRLISDARVVHFRSRSVASAPFIGIWQGARGSIYHFTKHQGLISGIIATCILACATFGRVIVGTLLAPLSKRYRRNALNQANVLRNIIMKNPLGRAIQGKRR